MTLTHRQQQILTHIATELTTLRIASALGLLVPTHRRNLFRKAGVHSGVSEGAMRQRSIE